MPTSAGMTSRMGCGGKHGSHTEKLDGFVALPINDLDERLTEWRQKKSVS